MKYRDYLYPQSALRNNSICCHTNSNMAANISMATLEQGALPASTVGPSVSTPSSTDAFDNLYPAIVQCFVIIFSGYIAGRTNMISSMQAKGIGNFVSKFALPALLFKSMAELKFGQVNWEFLLSILISKTVVFAAVLLFELLLGRPVNYGKGGLYAIFATQSNDFALGYPIIQALYRTTHPEFLQYIYLIAPISLVILNPIGFILLEVEKRRSNSDHEAAGKCAMALHVLKGVILNPVVFMTFVGVIGNFVFKQDLPDVLDDILTVLGNAFTATALFYLGLSMVGKFKKITGPTLITPLLLIVAKTLLLPFLTREFVLLLQPTSRNANHTLDLSMFGFLYGTIPTAPSVFLYASQYSIAADTIATAMVLCTFLSAPLMFITAKMVTLTVMNENQYNDVLKQTSFDISILGVVCSIWTCVILILNRRWRRIPQQLVFCLVIAQFISCLGIILSNIVDHVVPWQHYVQFIVFLVGVFSTRVWTALIAVGICLLKMRSLCFVLKARPWMVLTGFGLPVFLTGMLIMLGNKDLDENDPSFQYGQAQLILSACVLILTAIATIVALVLQHRYDKKHTSTPKYEQIKEPLKTGRPVLEESESDIECSSPANRMSINAGKECTSFINTSQGDYGTTRPGNFCNDCACGTDVEDLGKIKRPLKHQSSSSSLSSYTDRQENLNEHTCLLQNQCSPDQRRVCLERLRQYEKVNTRSEDLMEGESCFSDYQITRHVVLLLVLTLSMFMGIFLCLWRLFNDSLSGLYIELEFLDCVFNFGQAFFVWAIFGLDTKLIIIPFLKKWRKLIYGVESIHLPDWDELDDETRQTCEQFNTYHKEQCRKDIVKDRRYRIRKYRRVFTGEELVMWLLEVGLAVDELDAVTYGQRLVLGRVVTHVTEEHHFYNLPYFYRFADEILST